MFCLKCHTYPSIRDRRGYISILCKCQITIVYNNNKVTTIKKENYKPKTKGDQPCQ